MTQSTPFKSVGQCLYIAYLMEVLPVTVKSSAQRIMEASMMQSNVWGPVHGSTTHPWFDRLTPLDIRAQCALIRLKVTQHLPLNEQGATWAHYGHLLTKAKGVEVIAQAARVFTTTKNADAILALT